jgi:hypothetical protein
MQVAPSEWFNTALEYSELLGGVADNLANVFGLSFDDEDHTDT